MNYLKQLNHFYKFLPNNPLSSNAQCLYCYLLNKNNELGWIKEFTVANSIICGFTNIDRRTLDRVRNELIQKGYIEYKKGIGSRAGKYLIVQFDTQCDIQYDTQYDTQVTYNMTHNMTTLNKLNKTKLKKKNIEKEFIAPSLEEIKQYVNEKKLKVDADYFYNYFTEGKWIDSKGKEVKNWKQKLLTWDKHSTQEIKDTPNKPMENYADLDTSQLTEKENIMLLQGKITIDELIQKGRIYVGRGT